MTGPRTTLAFSPIEIASMVEATPSAWWGAFITLGVSTGLRVSEMLWLAWSDIDHHARSVIVTSRPALATDTDEQVVRPTLPVFRERIVPIPAETLAAIDRHRRTADPGSMVFVPDWKLDQLWPFLVPGSSVSSDRLAPGIAPHFRYVQRFARLSLARRIDESIEQVHWVVRPLSALRSTYAIHAAARNPPDQVAEYLGLRREADLSRLLAGVRSPAEATA